LREFVLWLSIPFPLGLLHLFLRFFSKEGLTRVVDAAVHGELGLPATQAYVFSLFFWLFLRFFTHHLISSRPQVPRRPQLSTTNTNINNRPKIPKFEPVSFRVPGAQDKPNAESHGSQTPVTDALKGKVSKAFAEKADERPQSDPKKIGKAKEAPAALGGGGKTSGIARGKGKPKSYEAPF
jgi:hypothetical protein